MSSLCQSATIMDAAQSKSKKIDITGKTPQPGSGDTNDESVVWENFKQGNQSALIYIYRNYANQLFNYGCQFLNNRELVRDAVQDLFVDLIKSKDRLGKTTSIKYYLFKSLRNRLLRIRNKESQTINSLENHEHHAFILDVSPESILIYRQLDDEKRMLIKQKLNELAPLQREALLLYFYEGLGYQQIAEILGIKVKSSRALIYRGIGSLQKLLEPWKNRITILILLSLSFFQYSLFAVCNQLIVNHSINFF